MRLRSFCILLFLGAAFGSLRAQNTFIKRFDLESSIIAGNTPIQTSDGGYVVGGSFGNDASFQMPCLVKFDRKGNLLWTKIIGSGIGGHIYGLASSQSGGFFTTGPLLTDAGSQLVVMKCDSLGNTIWSRTLAGGQIDSNSGGIAAADDGGCIVTGDILTSGFQQEDIFAMKLAPDGKTEWVQHIIPDPLTNVGSIITSVIRFDSVNYLLSGYAVDLSVGSFFGLSMIQLHSSGSIGWYRVIHGPVLGLSAVPLSDGGFAVCGETFDNSTFTTNLYTAAFDPSGAIRWGKQVDVFTNAFGQSIAEAANGDLIICGAYSSGADSLSNAVTDSALFVRMDKQGNLRTIKTISVAKENSIATGIIHSSDGGFVYTGVIGTDLTNDPFGLVLGKLNDNGEGCDLKNQLASIRAIDSVFDAQFTFVNDLTVSPLDINTRVSLTLTETDICSAEIRTVEPSPNFSEENIFLYPNPLIEHKPLTITLGGSLRSGNYDLSLYDLLGNSIKKEKINLSGFAQDIIFDVPECAAGMYIIELRSEKEPVIIRRTKLVKE